MPAVQRKTNSNSRNEPYKQGEGEGPNPNAEAESQEVAAMDQVQPDNMDMMSPEEEAMLNAAAAQATPRRAPARPRCLPINLLTRDVLRQCIKFGEVKDGDKGSKLCFCDFDIDKFYELTGIAPGTFDLQSSGHGHCTVMTPLMQMPFGLSNTWIDDNTKRPKWSVPMSFYNPEGKPEITEFQQWLSVEFKEAITDLLVKRAREFDEEIPEDEEPRMIKRDMMKNYSSSVRKPKDPKYSPQCSIKIKSIKDSDVPIIKVWDQGTEKKVPYANVKARDFGQAFIYFEGISKVGSSYYERWITKELVHCDTATRQEIASADDEYPLSVDMSAFASAAQRVSSAPSPNPAPTPVASK